jgi:hypothetical protein
VIAQQSLMGNCNKSNMSDKLDKLDNCGKS